MPCWYSSTNNVRGHNCGGIMTQASTSARKLIDCSADPIMPGHKWSLVSHTRLGPVEWDPTKIGKFQPQELREGKNLTIGRVVDSFSAMNLLGAANGNLLDFMLQHQSDVPTSVMLDPAGLRKISLIFPGTVYKFGSQSVIRYLYVSPKRELACHWKPLTSLLLDSEYLAFVE